MPLVDRELRLIAHRYMRWERPGHTLQTRALVNEAYLRRIAPLHRFGNILLGVFTFLGFTHNCGKRRSSGTFIVWRETAKKRLVAKLRAIKAELRRRMHEPVASVGE